ncbi:MAG: sensor histidine kinase [Candidatus Sumerlaeota bacterium]
MVSKTILDNCILEHFAQRSSSLVIAFDQSLKVAWANQAAEKLLGNDLEGREAKSIFLDFSNTLQLSRIPTDSPRKRVLSLNTPSSKPLSLAFSLYRHTEGLVAIGEADMEEAENLRNSLLEINRELSNATRELHQKNAQLKRLNDLKDDFLGIAAHDLRSPIAAIQTYAELLLQTQKALPSEDSDKFLHTIHSLSEFMLIMISELLDITAFETGKVKLNPSDTRITLIIENVLEIYTTIAKRHRISIEFLKPESERAANVDYFKLRQVFENIINNAIKYSPDNTRIDIELTQDSEKTTVKITDQGAGIPKADLKNIFKPFARSKSPVRSGDKSTGLGLSICKRIVEAHNGNVLVESTEDSGSTFTILIPY